MEQLRDNAPRGSRWSFRAATREDDFDLRRIVRDQPSPGWIEIGYEREPNFFLAGDISGAPYQVLISSDSKSGRPALMMSRAVRKVFVNGAIRRLGYISQGRIDPSQAGRHRAVSLMRDSLRASFEMFHSAGEMPFDIQSLLNDATPARRIFTANLPGMPVYRKLTDLTTLGLWCRPMKAKPPPGVHIRCAAEGDVPGICSFLQSYNSRYQFAPVWDEETLRSPLLCRGLDAKDFLLAERGGKLVACLALWDQRAFKQLVVRGYRPLLSRTRPLFNLAAPVLGMPRLPQVGTVLPVAWLSHLAGEETDPAPLMALVRTALGEASRRGLEAVLVGMADGHPHLAALTGRFRHMHYHSTLFLVHRPEQEAMAKTMAARPVHVEVATL